MLPVFINLLRRLYFMRAAARQLKYRIKELYRQTGSRSRKGAALLLFGTEMQKLQTFALCRIDRAALRTSEKSRFSGKLILLKYKYSRIEAIPDWAILCFQVEFTKKICVINKKIRKGLQVFVHPGEENESETPLWLFAQKCEFCDINPDLCEEKVKLSERKLVKWKNEFHEKTNKFKRIVQNIQERFGNSV